MDRKQLWIMLSAALAIVAGAITPWLLRSPQTQVKIACALAPELPVAEFATLGRAKPQTNLVGAANLFHPGRGVVEDAPPVPAAAADAPAGEELGIALQSIGRINNLACANFEVGTGSHVVPAGNRVPGTDWRLEAVHSRGALLRDGDETLTLTVGDAR